MTATFEPEKNGLETRLSRFLGRHSPRGLYRRAMLILIVPLVLLQLITSGLILNSYWDGVTKALGRSLSREIGLITELYEKSDKSDAAIREKPTVHSGLIPMHPTKALRSMLKLNPV
jgi:two-component system, OmpR family, osmolarity sensor histidine kinase EnvZ